MFRLLVPLDGSELSERAIPWADQLAGALPAEVSLLRVVTPMELPDFSSDDVYDSFVEQEVHEAARALALVRGKFSQATEIGTDVLVGSPADVIVERAHTAGADFIVMATHSRSGLPRAILGSVTGRVIRRSGVPVMAIRPDLMALPRAPRRILIPLDGSDLSAAVVSYASRLARALHATLVLYSVVRQGPIAPIATKLEGTAEAISRHGIAVETRTGEGDPGTAILAFAGQCQCGLIAMSTHGREGVGRWAMGSVTDWVLHHAPVPVMAVRPLQVPASTVVGLRAEEPQVEEGGVARVALTSAEARVTRVALEHLAWSATRHDHLVEPIRGALRALDAAREGAATEPVRGEPFDNRLCRTTPRPPSTPLRGSGITPGG